MLRGEAYRLLKDKIRRFCDASIEPSDGAARKLIFELSDIVDQVRTDSGPTLAGMGAKAIESLFETGLLVRKCSACKEPVSVCKCARGRAVPRRHTYLELDRARLRALEAL
jgi:hypothetical protein